jgi:hypothetical protein
MDRMVRRLGHAAILWLVLCGAAPAEVSDEHATEAIVPPPEASEGEDYEIAAADSLDDDTVEVGIGATGRHGLALRRTRRIRFRGEGLNGAMREGTGDPLAGGTLAGRVARGTLEAGRIAPSWGRGVMLGAPAEPWDARAADRGAGAGRAAEGVRFAHGEDGGFETLAGTFERRRLGGARLFRGPWQAATMTDARHRAQSSLAFGGARDEVEFAIDQRGRWRIDGLRTRAAAGGEIEAHARAGSPGFRSLAEPRRSGPSLSATVRFISSGDSPAVRAIVSWWRFRPGLAGARAALLMSTDLRSGAAVIGLEEQHGPRRASGSLKPRGMRQGLWGEWTARAPGLTASFRHEVWGGQRLRAAVRRASGVRIEAHAPGAVRVRVAHTAFQVGFGESLYLREAYSDRLVLRALTGRGTRTRVECRIPAAGGRLTLSAQLTRAHARPGRLVWTFDWARAARTRRGK